MKSLFAFALLLIGTIASFAQPAIENAADHMKFLTGLEQNLSRKYLNYMSEVAHGQKPNKIEKLREEVIVSIREALQQSGKLKPYKGDASLRDSFKAYWNVLLLVFTEDYHKIVDMEPEAETSVDEMEKYLRLQEKANEKLNIEYKKVEETYESFALKNDVRLIDDENKLNKKLQQTGKINKYMNQIYLISFKSTLQEELMVKAFDKNNVQEVDLARREMIRFAEEGLNKLDTMRNFEGDNAMSLACRKLLEFHKTEGEKATNFVEFLTGRFELDNVKASVEGKTQNTRTKEDLDGYIQAVDNYNKLATEYNKISHELNVARDRTRANFEVARKSFVERHTPRA